MVSKVTNSSTEAEALVKSVPIILHLHSIPDFPEPSLEPIEFCISVWNSLTMGVWKMTMWISWRCWQVELSNFCMASTISSAINEIFTPNP